jgi:hypothetical protein
LPPGPSEVQWWTIYATRVALALAIVWVPVGFAGSTGPELWSSFHAHEHGASWLGWPATPGDRTVRIVPIWSGVEMEVPYDRLVFFELGLDRRARAPLPAEFPATAAQADAPRGWRSAPMPLPRALRFLPLATPGVPPDRAETSRREGA